MKNKTLQARTEMLKHSDIPKRMEYLRDLYKGETAYIVAAGPSLNRYEKPFLRNRLKDELVISIKQSYNLLGDVCDFHLLNWVNFNPYKYESISTIIAWTYYLANQPNDILLNNIPCDVLLPIYRNDNIGNSICEKYDFDSLSFDHNLARPWGPGIMYEMAIPLALFLGVKKIKTLCWDIGEPNSYSHFYDDNAPITNSVSIGDREYESMVKSTEHLYNWFNRLGVEFEIISDRNPSYKGIPRVEL